MTNERRRGVCVSALARLLIVVGAVCALAEEARSRVSGWSVAELYKVSRADPPDLYADYDFGPVEDWFNVWDLKDYREYIASGNCGRATIVLRKAFKRRYPGGPDPMGNGPSYSAFRAHVLPRHYPDLQLCDALEELQTCLAKLRAAGWKPARFPQHTGRLRWDEASQQQNYCRLRMSRIVHLSLRDHGPAHLKLVQLSEVADVIRLTPEYRYYALLRARRAGVASDDLAPLLETARRSLDKKARERIEKRAETGQWPRAEPLVLDGQRGWFERWFRRILGILTGVR